MPVCGANFRVNLGSPFEGEPVLPSSEEKLAGIAAEAARLDLTKVLLFILGSRFVLKMFCDGKNKFILAVSYVQRSLIFNSAKKNCSNTSKRRLSKSKVIGIFSLTLKC